MLYHEMHADMVQGLATCPVIPFSWLPIMTGDHSANHYRGVVNQSSASEGVKCLTWPTPTWLGSRTSLSGVSTILASLWKAGRMGRTYTFTCSCWSCACWLGGCQGVDVGWKVSGYSSMSSSYTPWICKAKTCTLMWVLPSVCTHYSGSVCR